MDNFFYYGIFRKTIVQLASIFNNIKVAKQEADGTVIRYTTVPVKFETKDKMYQSLMDNKRTRPLPMMALNLYGITHDPMRVGGKPHQIIISKDGVSADRFLTPAPYNLDFQMSIVTKYMVEMDQILEQILSYFNPFVFTRIKLDETGEYYFDIKISFTSATPDLATDLTEQDVRVVAWTLYFTAYTYLFTPVTKEGLTQKIIAKFYTDAEAWTHHGTESTFTSGGSGSYETESMFLKAIGYDDSGDIQVEEHWFGTESVSGDE